MMTTIGKIKESLCKNLAPILALTLLVLSACGADAPAKSGELQQVDQNSASRDTMMQKDVTDLKATVQAMAAQLGMVKSDTGELLKRSDPASDGTLTNARCQALLPYAIGGFNCGPMGGGTRFSTLSISAPNPAIKNVDCVVNLTNISINTTPVKELHATGWNLAGDLTNFWVNVEGAKIFCAP
jgi:hypothetical protein